MKVRNEKVLTAFGKRLQDVRLNAGLPREDLSVKAGISVGQIGRIERGEINTTLSTISALASALGMEPKDLLDFSQLVNEKIKLKAPKSIIDILKKKLGSEKSPSKVKIKGGYFKAWLDKNGKGVLVSNLGKNNLLEWKVFTETLKFLNGNSGNADRGNAMMYKLGEVGLPLESIEGHLAKRIYKKNEGDSVFRRITPIASILVWSGVCRSPIGKLALKK